jgi:hypothetical protein
MTLSEQSSCPCCNGCRGSLRDEVKVQMLLLIAVFLAVLALVFTTGCTRTVLVSESSPIRMGPEVRGKIYTKTADGWQLGDNEVRIPEGWYCVPPSFVEEHK